MSTVTVNQPTAAPTRKVTFATLGGASLTPLLIWLLREFAGVDMPDPVIGSIGAILGGIFGYFTKNAVGDR